MPDPVPDQDIEQFFLDRGITVIRLSLREQFQLQQVWRRTFARRLKNATGKWEIGGRDWHVFSGKYAAHTEGGMALKSYAELPPGDFWVVTSASIPAYKGTADALPDMQEFLVACGTILDVYISGMACEWTMVFTHEDNYGPYFARKEWQET